MNNIDDSRIKKKATQNRAGYSAPPDGLSGADLSAWLESQHKLWQDELAAAQAELAAAYVSKKTELQAKPLNLPLPPPLIRGLPVVAREEIAAAEAENGPVTATVAKLTSETTSTLALPGLNTRVIQGFCKEISKEIYKDEYKSDTRMPGGPAASGAVVFNQIDSKPKANQGEAVFGQAFWSEMFFVGEVLKFKKSAKTKSSFRQCFELGRLLKFSRKHSLGLDEEQKVQKAAAELMILWEDVEKAAEQVRQNLNEDAFKVALDMGVTGVTGLDELDPALRPVAALAFQLQLVAGTTSTIYLVQTKIAQAFNVSQPAISRVLHHLKKINWLEEVGREKRGRKDFVRYRCPSAIAQNVPVAVVEEAKAIEASVVGI